MFLTLAICALYALAMTAANLTVAHFGPVVTPLNAFFLIGLDLVLRDFLHVRLKPWWMALLIAATSLITLTLNPAAGAIAIASCVAFLVSSLADWFVFSVARGTWLSRSLRSNVVGAAVDSTLFPLIAFGALMPGVMLAQFVAKVAGGALWAAAANWLVRRAEAKVVAA